MGRRIVIDPVTRVEGRAHVTIELGDDGRPRQARVHLSELRGFEAVLVGRTVAELPALTARICGICPVAHALAAARAGDILLGAPPPPAAERLRELAQLAQVVQSHALSFFYLSAPDFVFGHGGDPARRNFLGLAETRPDLAADGVRLRRFGQEAIAEVAGQRVHAAFAVPGGVARPLDPAARDRIAAALPGALQAAERTLAWWLGELPSHAEEARSCGDFDSLFLALVGPGGDLAFSGGRLRLVDGNGAAVADGVDPASYAGWIGEAQEPWTAARLAYYLPMGYPAGLYRVGPLARLNAVGACGTPRADRALRAFRVLGRGRGTVGSTFHAHLARLVEILHALERIEALLLDPELVGTEVVTGPGRRAAEAVGACEAPRGTLLHHYRAGEDGIVRFANLVVATGQNALAMNRAVKQIADRWLDGERLGPDVLNRVEAGIRAFDPCLSCASHAAGGRTTAVRLLGPGGELLDESPPAP